MAKSNKVKPKKRGRPATGKDPLMGFRASPEMRASVVRWAENQPDKPSLSEAIRRLVELGLPLKTKGSAKSEDPVRSEGTKGRARELAGNTIDKLSDATASADDQAIRKRRLLKGPEEFQRIRVDRSSRKT